MFEGAYKGGKEERRVKIERTRENHGEDQNGTQINRERQKKWISTENKKVKQEKQKQKQEKFKEIKKGVRKVGKDERR